MTNLKVYSDRNLRNLQVERKVDLRDETWKFVKTVKVMEKFSYKLKRTS